jgi:DNA-binding GntR family transcriptional regulator
MVEHAAEAIVAAAARGAFLPGDRLVETEIARDLGISRVPVREALRTLESQGIVVCTPYKGMRLTPVTNRGVAELMRVRLALEILAVKEATSLPGGETRFVDLRRAAEAFACAARGGDPAAVVAANERFHTELCRTSGNGQLVALWQSLARRLTVIWCLAQQHRDAALEASEHEALVTALEHGATEAATATLAVHIDWHRDFNFEDLLRRRRDLRHG